MTRERGWFVLVAIRIAASFFLPIGPLEALLAASSGIVLFASGFSPETRTISTWLDVGLLVGLLAPSPYGRLAGWVITGIAASIGPSRHGSYRWSGNTAKMIQTSAGSAVLLAIALGLREVHPTAAFVLGLLAAAIRLGALGVHTWQGDLHADAAAPLASMISTVFVLEGFSLLVRDLLPSNELLARGLVDVLGVFGLVQLAWGALLFRAIRDASRVAPAISLAHTGALLAGLAALNRPGLHGAVLLAACHGPVVTAVSLSMRAVTRRADHRHLDGFGGLRASMPRLAAVTSIAICGAIVLPPFGPFFAFLSVFFGAFALHPIGVAVSAASAVVLLAAGLSIIERTFLGPPNPRLGAVDDVTLRELAPIAIVVMALIIGGVVPGRIFDASEHAFNAVATRISAIPPE